MKIGIFGGCFNPPHNMHKKIGLELLQKKYVDKLVYVPTGNHYPKKNLIPAIHRYEMIKQMIEPEPCMAVSSYEIEHKSYTYETLTYFKNQYKEDEIYFICGIDNLKELSTWKNYKYILDHFHLLVINRNNEDIERIIENYTEFKEHIIVIPIKTETLSSTEIRELLKNQDSKVQQKLDTKVLQYIHKNKLYS